MPAAAVIPAPIAYIKVVAVKKLVVELRRMPNGQLSAALCGIRLRSGYWLPPSGDGQVRPGLLL